MGMNEELKTAQQRVDKAQEVSEQITFDNAHLIAYFLTHTDIDAAEALYEELAFALREYDSEYSVFLTE